MSAPRSDELRRPRGEAVAAEERLFLAEVRWLPGVTKVFPLASNTTRWFKGPVGEFHQEGPSAVMRVTIGVDRHEPVAQVVGLVSAYLRARLLQRGFDFIEVRVRVALLE